MLVVKHARNSSSAVVDIVDEDIGIAQHFIGTV
jgi:hypothetical protein